MQKKKKLLSIEWIKTHKLTSIIVFFVAIVITTSNLVNAVINLKSKLITTSTREVKTNYSTEISKSKREYFSEKAQLYLYVNQRVSMFSVFYYIRIDNMEAGVLRGKNIASRKGTYLSYSLSPGKYNMTLYSRMAIDDDKQLALSYDFLIKSGMDYYLRVECSVNKCESFPMVEEVGKDKINEMEKSNITSFDEFFFIIFIHYTFFSFWGILIFFGVTVSVLKLTKKSS